MAITRSLLLLIGLLSLPIIAAESLREQYAKPIAQWPAASTADDLAPLALGPLENTTAPASAQAIALGERLFHDPILSRDNSVSCSSCHDKALIFQDSKRSAVGIDQQIGSRNTPPIFGVDHWQSFFWDGRALTATEQALKPIENPIEMDLSIEEAIKRLNDSSDYQHAFHTVFGRREITPAMLAMTLVAFERAIPAPDTKYQRFIKLAQTSPQQAIAVLSDSELEGLHLFRTKAKCMTCHEGPLLSDNAFHVTGFHMYGRRFEDLGRVMYTQNPKDTGAFRTPSLLGVTLTGPWMHNGLFTEFTPMIMQYNKGGFRPKPRGKHKGDPFFPVTSELIVPLNLNKREIAALVEFLEIL